MDFGKLVSRFVGRSRDRKNRGQPDADGGRQRRRVWLVGRRDQRDCDKQSKGRQRAADVGNARLKPLTIKGTPVGQWLKRFAPDVLRAFADLVPAGFLLDSIAALIETRGMKQAERSAFDVAMRETRALAGVDVTKQWIVDSHSDSWLSKNVRPLVLLSLTLSFIVFAIINAVAPQFFAMSGTVAGMFETLLLTVFGAYFAGRTIEKTMK